MNSRQVLPIISTEGRSAKADQNGLVRDNRQNRNSRNSDLPPSYFGSVAVFCCLFALAVFFRQFFTSEFDRVAGNIGDNRLLIAILEHWSAFAHGKASFLSPNFYWPKRNVLAYSDALLLFWPPYALARELGADIYVAFESALMSFSAVGFFSMLWLLRSFLKLSRAVALVGSILFAISNLYFIDTEHGQLMTVAFVPLLACLAAAGWRTHERRSKSAGYLYGSLFGLLLACVLLTSFYIGWFAIFACALVMISAFIIAVLQQRVFLLLRVWANNSLANIGFLGSAGLVFLIASIPFFMTYLPVLKENPGRSFPAILFYSAEPIDILNIGQLNLVWGRLLEPVFLRLAHRQMVPSEVETGWPPFTLLVFITCVLLGMIVQVRSSSKPSALSRHCYLASILGLAFMVGWVSSVRLQDSSLWWFAFKYVPGASAIRALARFNLVLNVLLIVVVCVLLNEMFRRSKLLFSAAAILLIVEQINTLPTHEILRSFEVSIMSRVPHPPTTCAFFFLDGAATPDRPFYANQIDAMLIARKYNLPTLNGYSGWSPYNWDLNDLHAPSYLYNVRRWIRENHIDSRPCALDLRSAHWSQIDFRKVPYVPGSLIDFRTGGNADLYETEGWGDQEEGGSWTIGRHSILRLNFSDVPNADLVLKFKAHAFIVPQRPSFEETLRINGRNVANWTVHESQVEKEVTVPHALAGSKTLQIEFIDHDPKSPAEAGASADSRKLGLAMEALRATPLSSSRNYILGRMIDFRWGGNAGVYETEGWGEQEDGGSWTIGPRSTLRLNLPDPPVSDLVLKLRAHAFIVPQRPSFDETLRINGRDIANWNIRDAPIEKQVNVPRGLVASKTLDFEFIDHDPRSPVEVGYSADSRKLGLAIETLVLTPSSPDTISSKPK